MGPLTAPVLIADIFDKFRLQLPDGIVNWLTPVWILCLGAAAGLVLCATLWGFLRLVSWLPGSRSLSDHPPVRRIAIGVLTAVFAILAVTSYATALPGGVAELIALVRANLQGSLWLVLAGLLGSW